MSDTTQEPLSVFAQQFSDLLKGRIEGEMETPIHRGLPEDLEAWLSNPENDETIVEILEFWIYFLMSQPKKPVAYKPTSNPYHCPDRYPTEFDFLNLWSGVYSSGKTALHLLAQYSIPRLNNICMEWAYDAGCVFDYITDDEGRTSLEILNQRGFKIDCVVDETGNHKLYSIKENMSEKIIIYTAIVLTELFVYNRLEFESIIDLFLMMG
jgi:hypothetical protein